MGVGPGSWLLLDEDGRRESHPRPTSTIPGPRWGYKRIGWRVLSERGRAGARHVHGAVSLDLCVEPSGPSAAVQYDWAISAPSANMQPA